ncbi:MAG: ShlB/FhaC/HecB family hemolysin secretion/activation protein [Gammaproteobacteria bacterium]|nr:ShlB/FhaC/HecB family hemolysin secretion/activation protein [Gammaproteobacteria bacterium]
MRAASISTLCLWVACFLSPIQVIAVTLPPGATPGGADPTRSQQKVLPKKPGEVFAVPPLIDRPLDEDAGERLIVRTFDLRGVVDRPEFDISIKALKEFVEKLRLEKQSLAGEKIEGFTPGAIKQTAKILRQLISMPAAEQDVEQIKTLMDRLRDDEFNTGLTIGQLQEIANEVTNYYRRAGLILAHAYIPAQTVDTGVVIIQVLEGVIGRVTVENNQAYAANVLTLPFDDLVGKPVSTDEIESGLLRLTDYPGLSVFGVFRPGIADVGSTNLVLNVQEERFGDFSVHLDNYGTEFTGEGRAFVNVALNNPTNAGDIFYANFLKTFSPADGNYGSLGYARPIFNAENKFGITLSRNVFDSNLQPAFIIDGVTDQASLYWRHQLTRSRQKNDYSNVALTRKRAEVKLGDQPNTLDKLTILSIEYGMDRLDTQYAGINFFLVRYSHGFNSVFDANEAFDKIDFRYDRLQTLSSSQSLLFTISGQFSNDALTSIEQFGFGGPTSVRAYAPTEFLKDKGYFASLEWIIKAPGYSDVPVMSGRNLGDVFQVSVFVDAAGGWLNEPVSASQEFDNASGAGVGLRLDLYSFKAHLQIATPLSDKIAANDRDPQYYLELSYEY